MLNLWLVVTMLADAGIALFFSIIYLVKPDWYISGATSEAPTEYDCYQSNMVQGRGLMIVALLIFGALYRDPVVRVMIAGTVVAWCLFLTTCTMVYGYRVIHQFGMGAPPSCPYFVNEKAVYLVIMLMLFVILHSVGIVLTII